VRIHRVGAEGKRWNLRIYSRGETGLWRFGGPRCGQTGDHSTMCGQFEIYINVLFPNICLVNWLSGMTSLSAGEHLNKRRLLTQQSPRQNVAYLLWTLSFTGILYTVEVIFFTYRGRILNNSYLIITCLKLERGM
jgi:hypothetical protein